MARYYQFSHDPEPGKSDFFDTLGVELLAYTLWPENEAARQAFITRKKYSRLANAVASDGGDHLSIDIKSLNLLLNASKSQPDDEHDSLMDALVAGECVLALMGMYGETGEFSLGAVIRACSESLQTMTANSGEGRINHSEKHIRACLGQKGPVLHLCAYVRWVLYGQPYGDPALMGRDSVTSLAVSEAFRLALLGIEQDRTEPGKYNERNNKAKWPPTLLSPREMFQPGDTITRELWWPFHASLAQPMGPVSIPTMSSRMRRLITKSRKTPLR